VNYCSARGYWPRDPSKELPAANLLAPPSRFNNVDQEFMAAKPKSRHRAVKRVTSKPVNVGTARRNKSKAALRRPVPASTAPKGTAPFPRVEEIVAAVGDAFTPWKTKNTLKKKSQGAKAVFTLVDGKYSLKAAA